jgi:hypothetical protein
MERDLLELLKDVQYVLTESYGQLEEFDTEQLYTIDEDGDTDLFYTNFDSLQENISALQRRISTFINDVHLEKALKDYNHKETE